jgi:hypothetical protein
MIWVRKPTKAGSLRRRSGRRVAVQRKEQSSGEPGGAVSIKLAQRHYNMTIAGL